MELNIMKFIENEERAFMGEQMEKSLRQISEELGVIIEGEPLSAFLTIKEDLEEEFLFQLFDNENFLDFEVLECFANERENVYFLALYLLEEKPSCPFCGTTERKWFGLCLAEDSPKFCAEWHYDIEALYGSPYAGQRLRKVKPLIENFIATCWYWEEQEGGGEA